MNINFLKKAGIITASTIGAVYAIFLLAPFVISPIVMLMVQVELFTVQSL